MDASFTVCPGLYRPVTLVILGMILRVLVWSMMLLSHHGERRRGYYTALVASLGVGGITITTAVQTVLSDNTSRCRLVSISPSGSAISSSFGSVAGTIEHIGFENHSHP